MLSFIAARRGLACALILSSLGCAAATTKTPAAAPAAAPATKQTRASAAKASPPPAVPGKAATTSGIATSPDALEPPDGKWLVDDQGREYFAQEIPRIEGQYRWVDDTHKQAQFAYGLILDVLSYDQDKLVLKIYRPAKRVPRNGSKELTPEQKAKIATSYRPYITSVDRFTFRAFDEGLPREGQWREGFTTADIDGDGHLDLVHGPARKAGGSTPSIFLGDGQGHWRRWTEAVFPPVPFDYGDTAVADFNGDGRPDLAIASHLRGISVLIQEEKGTFRLWSQGIQFNPLGIDAFSSRAIQPVDWNRDGRPDLLVLGEGPRLMMGRTSGKVDPGSRGLLVYLNQGNGSWSKQVLSANPDDVYGDNVLVTDLDGDGRLDVLTGSSILGYRGLVNLGKEDGSLQRVLVPDLRPDAIFGGLAAGDFDRDGRKDFAVGYLAREGGVWRTGVDVLAARSANTWERRTVWSEESQDGLYALSQGDLNGDGLLDLVAVTGNGDGWIFLGDAKGGLVHEEGGEITIGEKGCRGSHVELADLDGDGSDEILAGFAGEGSELMGDQLCPSGGGLKVWKAVPRKP
jgi:hypothetical protein